MTPSDWKAKGDFIDIFGQKLFYIHHQTKKTTIAFLHGYPSSSYDYFKVIPYISTNYGTHKKFGEKE